MIPAAISAPATAARTATSIRTTTTPSCSPTTFRRCRPTPPGRAPTRAGCIVAEAESGVCRVICFSPRHDLTLARMSVEAIARVVQVWTEQYRELGADPAIGWVQIFENRGDMMGASNPHPHGQIWASRSLPNEPAKRARRADGVSGRTRALPAVRLSGGGAGRRRAHRVRERRISSPWCRSGRSGRSRRCCCRAGISARMDEMDAAERDRARRHPAPAHHPLRQSVRRVVPVFDGLPPAADRRRRASASGICTRISIRRCCARRRCASSWSASSCWPRRSATSRRKAPPRALREVPARHYLDAAG